MNRDLKIPVSDVVSVLIEEPVLIGKWKEFSRSLGLDEAKLSQLTYQFNNGNIKYHDLFVEIINDWVSKAGEVASVWELIVVLRNLHFNNAADKLEVRYLRRLKICSISRTEIVSPDPDFSISTFQKWKVLVGVGIVSVLVGAGTYKLWGRYQASKTGSWLYASCPETWTVSPNGRLPVVKPEWIDNSPYTSFFQFLKSLFEIW